MWARDVGVDEGCVLRNVYLIRFGVRCHSRRWVARLAIVHGRGVACQLVRRTVKTEYGAKRNSSSAHWACNVNAGMHTRMDMGVSRMRRFKRGGDGSEVW